MLAASFMVLCGLSLATGFILDSVAKVEKKQWEVNVYSKYTFGGYRNDNTNAR